MSTNKLKCDECDWHGTKAEMLKAPNPFCQVDDIYGCPRCFVVNRLTYACEHADCWGDANCGTPTPDGYAQTCGKHIPTVSRGAPTEKP